MQKHRIAVAAAWVVSAAFPLVCQANASPVSANSANAKIVALFTRVGPLAQPYISHGKTITEGVLEITRTTSSPAHYLSDAFYNEFVLRGTTPMKPSPLWFKVVQTCEKGSKAWVEMPVTGTDTQDLKSPAALLDVLDVQANGVHQH